MHDIRRRRLEDIREPNIDATGTHSNRVMKPGVRIKTYFDVGVVEPKAATFGVELTKGLAKDSLKLKRILGHVPVCLTEPSYGPVESGVKPAARTCKKLRKFDGLPSEVARNLVNQCEAQSQVKALQQLIVKSSVGQWLLVRVGSLGEILDIKGFAALFVLGYTGATAVSPTRISGRLAARP